MLRGLLNDDDEEFGDVENGGGMNESRKDSLAKYKDARSHDSGDYKLLQEDAESDGSSWMTMKRI